MNLTLFINTFYTSLFLLLAGNKVYGSGDVEEGDKKPETKPAPGAGDDPKSEDPKGDSGYWHVMWYKTDDAGKPTDEISFIKTGIILVLLVVIIVAVFGLVFHSRKKD